MARCKHFENGIDPARSRIALTLTYLNVAFPRYRPEHANKACALVRVRDLLLRHGGVLVVDEREDRVRTKSSSTLNRATVFAPNKPMPREFSHSIEWHQRVE